MQMRNLENAIDWTIKTTATIQATIDELAFAKIDDLQNLQSLAREAMDKIQRLYDLLNCVAENERAKKD